jgi:glycosyltransferase involved in cell wall biosynthesis
MNVPLISVIVPIYNVEPWLERCIDSIRNQTYQNLEIILVDDGSLDKCGEICDRYEKEDDRIKVIHKRNSGLSAARNAGLDVCHGDYIGFVDSDDVVHPEMYARLYADICTYHTSLAFCQVLICYDSNVSFPQMIAQSECLHKNEVTRRSLQGMVWFSACTKLYHRSLFDGIRYPEGRINEDYPVTMRIYDRCECIVVNHNKMYAYFKREGSITTSSLSVNSFDQIISAEEVHLFIKKTHPDYSDLSARILLSACIGLLLKTDGVHTKDYDSKRNELFDIIRRYFPGETRNTYLSFSQKALLSAAYSGKCRYAFASWIYKMIRRGDLS